MPGYVRTCGQYHATVSTFNRAVASAATAPSASTWSLIRTLRSRRRCHRGGDGGHVGSRQHASICPFPDAVGMMLSVQIGLLRLVQAQGHFLWTMLPLASTSVLGNLILPALAGTYLQRAARRRFRGFFWSSRAAVVLVPVCTILAARFVWPEVFVLAPAAAGLFTGWTLRERVAGKARAVALGGAIAIAIVGGGLVAVLLRAARIGVWDALAMLVAAGLGYLGGCFIERKQFPWKPVALAGASTLVTLGICEVLVRFLLPILPMYYSTDSNSIRFPAFDRERGELIHQTPFDLDLDLSACTPLYANDIPYQYAFPQVSDLWQPIPPRAVLHVGDSMVRGIIVDWRDTFSNLLQQATPDVRQINLGVSKTAPDFYLLMERKWAARLPLQLVVVHLFLGNDIEGLGQPSRCCADEPLLQLTDGRVEERCPTPKWRDGFGESLKWFAGVSPPPAIVRQLTPYSQFARYFVAVAEFFQKRYFTEPDYEFREDFLETRERSGRPPPSRLENQWVLLEAIMRALGDDLAQRSVPLVVSVLPLSVALEKPVPKATETYQAHTRILEILKRVNIEALDPWDEFESLVKREGHDAAFLPQGDVHLNAKGHRFYADWLLQRLGPRLGAR